MSILKIDFILVCMHTYLSSIFLYIYLVHTHIYIYIYRGGRGKRERRCAQNLERGIDYPENGSRT